MRLFHLLLLQGKLTGYDFIHTLETYTDNTGLYPPPVSFFVSAIRGVLMLSRSFSAQARLSSFMHMVREWRNLKMLKRAGRGHSQKGIRATKKGELGV